jgi:hypothetical protein
MSDSLQKSPPAATQAGDFSAKNLARLFVLTVFAFLVMGYHPGMEDDAFYLSAIKRHLNPSLFPRDADFFTVQFQATIYDKLIAFFVRLTHVPLAWTLLLWQFAAIFLILYGCWRISRRCFADRSAQWAAVAMIAALLTLPVSGTGISLADQYLHPRNLATAAIVAAVVEILDRRLWLAGVLLAFAFANHAIMASFGISFCVLLWWCLRARDRQQSSIPIAVVLLAPLGWIFEPGSDAWRQAASTRSFYHLSRWEWYEWLGVFAPLALIYGFLRFLRRKPAESGEGSALLPLASSLFYYGIFQTVVALIVMLPPGLERLRPFEPMRYLHLLYLFFFLLMGGLLGRHVLKRQVYRWGLLFVSLGAGMFYAQYQLYPATEHLELPGIESHNEWLRAFEWIRQNAPVDSMFAFDPHYMTLPGEDYHGFRALAERSAMADYEKDGGMAARVPSLAPRWLKEVNARSTWRNFRPGDFQRLRSEFGVNWIIVSPADAAWPAAPGSAEGITCPYENSQVHVCRLN